MWRRGPVGTADAGGVQVGEEARGASIGSVALAGHATHRFLDEVDGLVTHFFFLLLIDLIW